MLNKFRFYKEDYALTSVTRFNMYGYMNLIRYTTKRVFSSGKGKKNPHVPYHIIQEKKQRVTYLYCYKHLYAITCLEKKI